jgi:hypothetical protein
VNDRMCDQPFVRDGAGYIPLRRRDGSTVAWAVVDLADFEDVARFNWCQAAEGYAVSRANRGYTLMHRYLLGLTPGDGKIGDHIDRNRLNHRRSNLRVLPNDAANRQNQNPRRGSSSYRGVIWSKQAGKWRASVKIARHEYHVGFFTSEDEAGKAAAAFRLAHMPYATD